MPKGNNVLIVDSAGTITKLNTWTGKKEATDPLKVKAIEVPEKFYYENGRVYKETD